MNNSSILKEIIVNADEDSLNRAVTEKNIAPENIISVIYQQRGLSRSATTGPSTQSSIESKSSSGQRLHPTFAPTTDSGCGNIHASNRS